MYFEVEEAAAVLRQGGIVAYPTESCYGLGCDPNNFAAIRRILSIKRRNRVKGLILVSDHYFRFKPFIVGIPSNQRQRILSSWPGPNTWLLPAKKSLTQWLRGQHNSLAVRVSKHGPVRRLCRQSKMAIVSTSANRANRPSLRYYEEVVKQLGSEVDYVLPGRIGRRSEPSIIRDGISGEMIRG